MVGELSLEWCRAYLVGKSETENRFEALHFVRQSPGGTHNRNGYSSIGYFTFSVQRSPHRLCDWSDLEVRDGHLGPRLHPLLEFISRVVRAWGNWHQHN